MTSPPRSPRRRTSSSALPGGRRRHLWTPESEELARGLVKASPAGLAYVHSGQLAGVDRNPAALWHPAEHLLMIAQAVVAVVQHVQKVQHAIACGILPPDAQGPRLMVFMPPRHGKSELISRYTPAWFIGNNPELRVILTGYGTQFAGTWGRKVRDLLEEVGDELYGVELDPRSSKADDWDLHGRRGGMLSAGVNGSITGRGAHLFIVDDPVKNAETARSETFQIATELWWRETARTRMMPGAGAVVLQTRWHELDLSGQLLAADPFRDQDGKLLPDGERRDDVDGEHWEVLCLPGLALEDGTDGYGAPDGLQRAPGEALWPQMYPAHELARTKTTMGRYGFGAQYQQTPTPDEGGMFRRVDFRYWRYRDDGSGDAELLDERMQRLKIVGHQWIYRFATVDSAISEKETADWTVMALWGVTPDRDLLLIDVERHHFDQPGVEGFITRTRQAWGIGDLRVEAKAHGLALWQSLIKLGEPARKLEADTDKVTRAMGAVPRYEAHAVYHRLGMPGIESYERELLAFPNGAHDDQVDVYAYAALALPKLPVLGARPAGGGTGKTHTAGLRRDEM